MKKSRIVLISGKQGSGKSTLAKNLYFALGGGVKVFKFADPLYELHKACLPILKHWGIRPSDMDKDGELLQILGTEYGRRKIRDSVWIDICRERVDQYLADGGHVAIVDDARFENEVDIFEDALKVRLTAEPHIRQGRCSYWRQDQNHPSEVGLDGYENQLGKFDLTLNTGLLEKEEVLRLVMSGIDAKG